MPSILFLTQILDADSYKLGHYLMMPDGTNAAYSYIEPRIKGAQITVFGFSMWAKQYLPRITVAMIDEAESYATRHGLPFNRAGWEKIVNVYNGKLPITIRGLAEGTRIESSRAIVSVLVEDEDLWWLASYIETQLQRAIWYPTTIASNDLSSYVQLKWFYDHGSDNPGMLPFSLHSFASRGVSCREQAILGGISHLVYFQGTDDLVCLPYAKQWYNCDMAGFSVPASEHSVQCAYGVNSQQAYLSKMIDVFGKPGGIVSVVMDGYDIMREVDLLCTPEFVQKVRDSGCKFVARPDSGDMFELVQATLAKLEAAYGFTVNSKGRKVLNNVGIIQGDGITRTTLVMLAQRVHDLGYAPECVIYGSGGGLLQRVDRDTFSFAQKSSCIRIGDTWVETVKNPITDSGKKSKGGFQDSPDFIDLVVNGELVYNEDLATIRARATSGL